uniref:Ricin B-type lectin domain-containing protein n=1 Tax=Macrostomum lignano TaxID=282301 RepID=A0A1I8F593_9PLAT
RPSRAVQPCVLRRRDVVFIGYVFARPVEAWCARTLRLLFINRPTPAWSRLSRWMCRWLYTTSAGRAASGVEFDQGVSYLVGLLTGGDNVQPVQGGLELKQGPTSSRLRLAFVLRSWTICRTGFHLRCASDVSLLTSLHNGQLVLSICDRNVGAYWISVEHSGEINRRQIWTLRHSGSAFAPPAPGDRAHSTMRQPFASLEEQPEATNGCSRKLSALQNVRASSKVLTTQGERCVSLSESLAIFDSLLAPSACGSQRTLSLQFTGNVSVWKLDNA